MASASYYNPSTGTTLTRAALKELLNASIPASCEQIGDWYLIHEGEKPATTYGTYVTKGDIELMDGYYTQTYTLAEYPLAGMISKRLTELENAYLEWRNDTATFISSLGFSADADSRALQDISGLYSMAQLDSSAECSFMDADNEAHSLTAEQVGTLALEAAQATSAGYTQKWALRETINACTSLSELEAVNIEFTPEDFSA